LFEEGDMASEDKGGKTALILSAGAPHSPLIAGALYELWDKGRTFDVIYTSGAGALVGLLYAAPKGKLPPDALKSLVELGVSDAIYRWLPIGYKTFMKPGPFARPIRQLVERFKFGTFPLKEIDHPVTAVGWAYNEWIKLWETAQGGGLKRLHNDLVDLWAAAITPAPIHYWSKGVCDSLPFLEDIVDFDALNDIDLHFYMNAFSFKEERRAPYAERGPAMPDHHVDDYRKRDLTGYKLLGDSQQRVRKRSGCQMELFYNKQKEGIGPEEVRAAFAYPFIYPPMSCTSRAPRATRSVSGTCWWIQVRGVSEMRCPTSRGSSSLISWARLTNS
jgi:hypothetical protein